MSSTDDLFRQCLGLPAPDRATLAELLLDSLETEDMDTEEAWAEEIQRRSDAVHSGNYIAHDWREAIEDIRQQLRRS